MFGAKKLGEKLAAWLEQRAVQYRETAKAQRERDAQLVMTTVAYALEEVAKGVRAVAVDE